MIEDRQARLRHCQQAVLSDRDRARPSDTTNDISHTDDLLRRETLGFHLLCHHNPLLEEHRPYLESVRHTTHEISRRDTAMDLDRPRSEMASQASSRLREGLPRCAYHRQDHHPTGHWAHLAPSRRPRGHRGQCSVQTPQARQCRHPDPEATCRPREAASHHEAAAAAGRHKHQQGQAPHQGHPRRSAHPASQPGRAAPPSAARGLQPRLTAGRSIRQQARLPSMALGTGGRASPRACCLACRPSSQVASWTRA